MQDTCKYSAESTLGKKDLTTFVLLQKFGNPQYNGLYIHNSVVAMMSHEQFFY